MQSIFRFIAISIISGLLVSALIAYSPQRSTLEILESYVEDFRGDPAAEKARSFGLKVTGKDSGEWSVLVHGKKDASGKWRVDLREGPPPEPTFIYAVDSFTLAEIDAGRINGLTVQGKAFSSDITPMAVNWMDGVEKFDINPLSFHFWTRGFPEKVPFRSGGTRTIHSASLGVFYYQKGFRSAWANLAKGQGANNGPGQPLIAPFPTMVIVTKGFVNGKVKGEPVTAEAGEMIFVPPMTPHEWWNEKDEPAEAMLIFFGEGA